MKRLITAVIITMTALLAGCNTDTAKGYAINAAVIAKSGAELHASYDAVAAAVASDIGRYSKTERVSLQKLHNAITALRAGIDHFHPDGAQAFVTMNDLRDLYDQARSAYIATRDILEPRLDSMTPYQRWALEQWDDRTQQLDNAVQTLLRTPDSHNISDTVSRVLHVAATGVKLAVGMGVL